MSGNGPRLRSTSLPKDPLIFHDLVGEITSPSAVVEDDVSEAFEDARSEPDEIKPLPVSSEAEEFPDFELPPLETFLGLGELHWPPHGDAGSLAGSLELENDLLPSTPLTDEQLRHAESLITGVPINRLEPAVVAPPPGIEGLAGDSNEEDYDGYYDIKGMMMNAAEQAEEFAIAIWHKFQSWKVIHFSHLPQWLQDNDFLHFGHRPPLPTSECFKSIIRIHTETGNIWTHLLGTLSQ